MAARGGAIDPKARGGAIDPKARGGAIDPKAQGFAQWVFETYRDQLHLAGLEGSRRYRTFVESVGAAGDSLFGATRAQAFHIIKLGYPLRRAGYVTAVCSATVTAAEPQPQNGAAPSGGADRGEVSAAETYYAYAYWPKDACDGPPEYICLSPTFESRDGEYRHQFLWYEQFDRGYEHNEDLLSKIEGRLLAAVGDGRLVVDLAFYAGDAAAQEAAAASADRLRLGIRALAASVATQCRAILAGILQNHTHAAYLRVFRRLCDMCGEKVRSLITEERWLDLTVFLAGRPRAPRRTQCGQKLTPLTVREALHVDDINFAPWREVWAGRRASDLVVNGVAPMFSIYGNWTYLDGVGRGLFENPAMREKYTRSAQAERIVADLRKARAAAARGDLAKKDYRVGQLDARVYDSLAYAQEYVTLTDLAMCSVGEFVGRTLPAAIDVARRLTPALPVYVRAFEDPAMQARYIFDACYGAHMLHTRLGVVHADLHLNNITFYERRSRFTGVVVEGEVVFRARDENAVIAYVAGPRGEADTYVFPTDGLFVCLIDFSRAVLGPATRAWLTEEKGEAFAAGFFRGQVSRALRVLHFYVPTYVEKHQETIKGLLLSDPEAMFCVMTAVDFLAIGRNFKALLQKAGGPREPGQVRDLEVAPAGVRLAAQIEKLALEHLVVRLSDLAEARGRTGPAAVAGDAILPAAFAEYRYAAWARGPRAADAKLVDLYNGAAPLRYSSTDYDKFPPWGRLDDIERHLAGLSLAAVADRGTRPFLESRDLDGYLSVLQEEVRRRAEDHPAAATSSWIAE